jgi:phage host-nuclease inhibitor protein Gam
MTRARRQSIDVPVPQTALQADEFVQRIGTAQRELALIQAALDETVAAAKAEAEAKAVPLNDTITRLTEGLKVWATANRDKLTSGGATKTVKMPSGEIAWRIRPPSVSLSNVAALVAHLLADKRLGRFIRTKHEPDKEALLKEPDLARTLPGVTLKTGVEDFIVAPTGASLSGDGRAAA